MLGYSSSLVCVIILSVNCLTGISFAAPSNPSKPTKLGKEIDYRLPRSLLPLNYTVRLLPYLIEGNYTTAGYEEITLNCQEDTNNITLHSKNIFIEYNSIQVLNLATNELETVINISLDPVRDFLIIYLANSISRGNHYRLSLSFVSILNDQLIGLYRASYTENGQTKVMAVTQMEAADARLAFPCFDEPNMKATFELIIGRLNTMTTATNMPLKTTYPIDNLPGYVWDQYEPSLPMSTYLVAIIVSEFVAIQSPPELSNVVFRIWCRPSAINQTEYARNMGPRVLEFYENYFQIDFPLPKQDMAAIPDFGPGAMENWGLVTYRESALLFDEKRSSMSDKESVASVIAHELAHQWFGDLVTMDWWNDLWLNEGFASFMQELAMNAVAPEFQSLQRRVGSLQSVFQMDSLERSHPISVPVNNPTEINVLFDSISYSKGAALMRMLENILGAETFRRGLSRYLNSKQYGNAVQDDLWSALTQQAMVDQIDLPTDVKTIMDTWTLKKGYPLINIVRDYAAETAIVSQQRFLLGKPGNSSSDPTLYQWWVPLTYTSDFVTEKHSWIEEYSQSTQINDLAIPMNQWVVFNVDEMGYYRVNYDITNWALIGQQLAGDHEKIRVINRAQILDDSLNIARANLLAYPIALDLTKYLIHERDLLPWQSAASGLSYIDLMLSRSDAYEDFQRYKTRLITPLYQYTGFNETENDEPLLIYTRDLAVNWACDLKLQDCVQNARQYYDAWSVDPENDSILPANYIRIVICTAIENGGQTEWDFVYDRYSKSNVASEKQTLLSSLSCTTDVAILSRLLEKAINSTSGIRRQDAKNVFISVAGNSAGRALTFNFLRDHWTEMVNYFNRFTDLGDIIEAIAAGFNTQLEIDELKQFRDDHQDDLANAGNSIELSIERAETNLDWMNRQYDVVVNWLQQQPKSSSL